MRILLSLTAAVLITGITSVNSAEPAPGKQVEQSLKISDEFSMPYLLHLPKDYDERESDWPVMLFLHGRGESYGPLSLVKKWGPPRLAERGDNLPYIIVSPQCPGKESWTRPKQQEGLLKLLDHIANNYRVDQNRIYLTGLSMGGYGSWRLAADHPERFAAVAPVCGGGKPEDAEKLKNLPIWVFHGTLDTAVPFDRSVEMVEAIKKAGGTKIKFTSLEEIDHNCWSSTYATPALYNWFNKQTASGNRKNSTGK